MGHQADGSFFDAKREWSRRKDEILGYYLVPYLPKIAVLRRPVLIVDGFAGRGEFNDGEPGSPLIIARTVDKARAGLRVRVHCLFIERDLGLYAHLKEVTRDFPDTQVAHATFESCVEQIEERAKTCSVFLYLDPFTVEGIRWTALDRIFAALDRRQSIEVLMNFNVHSFCRRGLAALKMEQPDPSEEVPVSEWESSSTPIADSLSDVVGGDWWQNILTSQAAYPEKVTRITEAFCEKLRQRFREVCTYAVREKWQHRVPKYVLVFGSRSDHALELMNDAMCRAREKMAASDTEAPGLFEVRPEFVVPDSARLPALLAECSGSPTKRRELVIEVLRRAFCAYSSSEIRKAITAQIIAGRLASATGKSRVNDDVLIWRVEPKS